MIGTPGSGPAADGRLVLPPGYRLRHPTADDMPAAQRVLDASETADCGEPRHHEQNLVVDSRDPRMDLARNTWVVDSSAGELVAMAWIWAPLKTGEIIIDVYVHPEHRRRGIGQALLDLLESRAGGLAPDLPETAAPRLVLWAEAKYRWRAEALARRGFTKTREYYSMISDLRAASPAPGLPSGFELRTMRLGIDDRAVFEADNEAFAEHHLFEPYPYEEWHQRHLEGDDANPDLVLIGWDGDELAGYSLSIEAADGAVVGDLAVRPAWRKRGLGRALLLHTFALLARRGNTVARLFVDAENPTGALRLYERAGMRVERQFDVMEKSLR
jgi:mycothiol synthase